MDPQVDAPAEKHDTQVLHTTQLVSPELRRAALPTQVRSPVLQTVVTPGTVTPSFRGPTLPPVESPVVLQVESPVVLQVESPAVFQVELPVMLQAPSPKELWNDDSGVGLMYVPPVDNGLPIVPKKKKKPAVPRKPRKKKAPIVLPPIQIESPVIPQVQLPNKPAQITAVWTVLESLAPEEIEEVINRDEPTAEQESDDDDVSGTKKTKASRKPVKTTSQAAKKE
jgi:hypothetical protein